MKRVSTILAAMLVSASSSAYALTNGVVVLNKTNVVDGQPVPFCLTERAFALVRTLYGQSVTNDGSILELCDGKNRVVWNGFFFAADAVKLPLPDNFVADLFYDSNDKTHLLLLGRKQRFGIYKFEYHPVAANDASGELLPVRMPPGWPQDKSGEPLQPPFKQFRADFTWISSLALSREGRFLVVTVNKAHRFKYWTWTGRWSHEATPMRKPINEGVAPYP